MAEPDTENPRNATSSKKSGNQQTKTGGQVKIEDFSCTGPRNDLSLEFRVVKAAHGLPNTDAEFYLGTPESKFAAHLLEESNPYTVRTNKFGVGQGRLNLAGDERKKYTRLTIVIPGAEPKSVDIPTEKAAEGHSLKGKPKRMKISPEGEEISKLTNKYTVDITTFDKNGKPETGDILIRADGKVTIKNVMTGILLATDVTIFSLPTPATDNLTNNVLKGAISLIFTFTGLKRKVTFIHAESREEITKLFHLK